MPGFELSLIVLLSAIALLWYDSTKARDVCIAVAREACQRTGYQLLDDTVAIAALRLERDDDGRIKLSRRYSFEYSISGTERRTGSILMLGHAVSRIDIGLRLIKSNPPDDPIHH